MQAAEQVFSHKGYRQATLDEIIKIADTGKGTVYKYYKNKEHLFYTLIKEKNSPFVEELEGIEREPMAFPDKLGKFFLAVLDFMGKNYVIWQVLLFEITTGSNGWRLMRNNENTDYILDVRWGQVPTEEEINNIKKYYDILNSELIVLEHIINSGMEEKIIKPVHNIRAMTTNMYFGMLMMIFQHNDKQVRLEDLVDMLVDRFMNGYKI